MNRFIDAFIARLKTIDTHDDIQKIYYWIWDQKDEVAETARQINGALGLQGDDELKPDLPCLTVGSHSGLVVLAANPGWKPELNAKEDEYCRRSPEHYVEMMFDFFDRHPTVRDGVYSRWWSKAMKFIAMLPGQNGLGESTRNVPARWKYAYESKLLGGWDLFPWHSGSDGVTRHAKTCPWLNDFFRESIQAALRLSPKLLFVASKTGYQLVRDDLLSKIAWQDFELGPKSVKGCYARYNGNTEVVAIKLQIFANAFRNFTNEQLFEKVQELRSAY